MKLYDGDEQKVSSFFQWHMLSLIYGSLFSEAMWLFWKLVILYTQRSLFYHENISFNLSSQKVNDNMP